MIMCKTNNQQAALKNVMIDYVSQKHAPLNVGQSEKEQYICLCAWMSFK